MDSLMPVIFVLLVLLACLLHFLFAPSRIGMSDKPAPTVIIDEKMKNKNKGLTGAGYSQILQGCTFRYLGWERVEKDEPIVG